MHDLADLFREIFANAGQFGIRGFPVGGVGQRLWPRADRACRIPIGPNAERIGLMLLARFHWILYLFGLLLLVTGVKMLLFAGKEPDIAANPVLRWMRRHMNVTDEHHGERFFVMRHGVRYATPLFLVLVLVEATDLIFAVDSIPAIFAVTDDPFIVFTSNIFAILGLRAMYFLLVDMAERFHLLKYGLAVILMFIGAKMLLLDVYKIPVGIALGIVGLILLVSVAASLVISRRSGPDAEVRH